MFTWTSTIIPHESNTTAEASTIKQLNKLLHLYNSPNTKFNTAQERAEYNQGILEEIIELCEQFITNIPVEERSMRSDSIDVWYESLCVDHPNLLTILEIEKQAVSKYYLPEAETDAKARWLLLKEIFGLDSGSGKPLEEEYWGELKFNGEVAIVNWLKEANYESKNAKLSLYEVIQKDQKTVGVDKQAVSYLENPKDFITRFDNAGNIYFKGKLLDTSRASGSNIQSGVCIFAADVDGTVYTNNPAFTLYSDMHHSSFLKGRPVMCAGTLRVSNGQITEITLLSGHYKPNKKELLNFLNHLSTQCHVDLSKVTVIDKPDGAPKNALKYIKTLGNCLPDDVSLFFYELAVTAFRNKDWGSCEKYLEQSIQLGNKKALCEKAGLLLLEKNIYPLIPENERGEIAKNILNDLATSAPRQIALQARQLLFQHFNINSFNWPLVPEQKKISSAEKLSSLMDLLKQSEGKESELADQKPVFNEIYELITNQNGIKDLHSLFRLVKSHEGFIKQDDIIFRIQQRAFELAKKEQIGITPTEEKQLREMWRELLSEKSMALSIFKTVSFEKQFDDLVQIGQIKLAIPRPSMNKTE